MARKGLNQEKVVEVAITLIEEKGYKSLSARELADRLEIKAASLYNHVDSLDTLYTGVGKVAIEMMIRHLEQAVKDLYRDEALISFAEAYRDFVKKHSELYRSIVESGAVEESHNLLNPLNAILKDYCLTDRQIKEWQQVIWSTVHGFVSLESKGCLDSKAIDCYRLSIKNCLAALEALERVNKIK